MIERTVDWSAFGTRAEVGPTEGTEGLRERKKRLLRQQLSDTATEMFLAEGFDAVRVAEIAAACGVSEKTVFNHFPTKEALILDRFETAPGELAAALAEPQTPPVSAALRVLTGELAALTGWMDRQPDFSDAARQVARFGALLASTPSLRAHRREAAARLAAEAAQALAERSGVRDDDPEVLVVAHALVGLWWAQYGALRAHLMSARSGRELFEIVAVDLHRAAGVLSGGLDAWPIKASV